MSLITVRFIKRRLLFLDSLFLFFFWKLFSRFSNRFVLFSYLWRISVLTPVKLRLLRKRICMLSLWRIMNTIITGVKISNHTKSIMTIFGIIFIFINSSDVILWNIRFPFKCEIDTRSKMWFLISEFTLWCFVNR